MRITRKVFVWSVGLVGGRRYERFLVENGKVVGWYTGWRVDRFFVIDMVGEECGGWYLFCLSVFVDILFVIGYWREVFLKDLERDLS